MKATGIVRRIDDLGRITIPKEVRRTLRIREGNPLEIFIDRQGKIILKRYSPFSEISTFAEEYAKSLSEASGNVVCIVDGNIIVAVSGGGEEKFKQKYISAKLEKKLEIGAIFSYSRDWNDSIPILEDESCSDYITRLVVPIIADDNILGAIISLSTNKKTREVELESTKIAAQFLGRMMRV